MKKKKSTKDLVNATKIQEMRKRYNEDFFNYWEKGFNYYIHGEWEQAREMFKMTLDYFKTDQDGPSITLLEFLKENNYTAPAEWKGIHKLTSK